MGDSRIDTTQLYTDEIVLEELAAALDRAAASRKAQASPDPTTLEAELTDDLETLRWRRRESNPRSQDSVDASRPRSDRDDSDEDESDLDPTHKPQRPEGLA